MYTPKRAVRPAFALPLDKETADMRPVPFIIRIVPRHRLEHFFTGPIGRFGFVCESIGGIGHLVLDILDIVFCLISFEGMDDTHTPIESIAVYPDV